MVMSRVAPIIFIGLAAVLGLACEAARQSQPMTGALPKLDTPKKQAGEVVFMRNCNQCHPGGEGGLGPYLNNKPAPAAAIKLVINVGPGEMPSFTGKLSPDEIDAVADYVVALRNTKSDKRHEDEHEKDQESAKGTSARH